MTPLTVGSLFSGIGGLDLGLERAGMTVAWQSEIDPYCRRVLAKHWPDVPNLGDVTLIDWSEVPRVDLICGGYPCQPFSQAGRRLGDKDPRHLWPWMLNAIRVLRPRYALLENVPGHLALGFGRVLGDLAEIGYDTEWDCIPAAAVGAPHRRDRVFIVAYPHGGRHGGTQDARRVDRVDPDDAGPPRERQRAREIALDRSPAQHVADADVDGLQGQQGASAGRHEVHPHIGRHVDRRRADVGDADRSGLTDVQGGPAFPERAGWRTPRRAGWWDVEPDVGGAVDGFSAWLDRSGRLNDWESGVARVARGVPHRVDRLRALGNAVVPQVAEHIGRLIAQAAA